MPGPTRSSKREPKVQPPRPRNAWILYRSHHSAILRQNQAGIAQSTISQMVSIMWREETEDVKRRYEKLAEEEKIRHQQLYPNYRFCPQKKEDKLRAKEELKAQAKEAKERDATPSDASTSSVTPAMPPVPALPSPSHWPNDITISQQYPLPEAFYGHCGPSPPLSAAPSPVLVHSSLPSSDEPAASSSSSSLVRSFTIPESLPTLPQRSTSSEIAPPAGMPSSGYTVASQVTAWNNEIPMPTPENSESIKFTVPVNHDQNYPAYQQPAAGNSQLDLFFSSDENVAFNMSAMSSSNSLLCPPGDLDLAEGDNATVDHHGQFLDDKYDFHEFERQVASFAQADLTSPAAVALPTHNDLETLFYYSNSTEADAYNAPQLHQSSASFPQDPMTAWLNLDDDTEDSAAELPTVAPQQIHLDHTQQVAAIFTQMTNVPAPPASPYVPPAGAVNSSTRRVGGSWKPPFYGPGQTEDSIYSWTFSTN